MNNPGYYGLQSYLNYGKRKKNFIIQCERKKNV